MSDFQWFITWCICVFLIFGYGYWEIDKEHNKSDIRWELAFVLSSILMFLIFLFVIGERMKG